jgi:RimJ/RimL family protein N-acetyltransferase
MPFGFVNTVEHMEGLISDLLQRQARGTDMPFAIALQGDAGASAELIGMTRFMSIERHHRGLEVGGSWLGRDFRRTACNTEAKYLLFKHAFETLGCVRLQLKTDVRNERSQRAIEHIGAMREGILRNNMILQDGYVRSSVYYSIIDSEWPTVRARLEAMLAGT